MSSSFKRNYVLSDPVAGGSWQLLCSWDFSVTNEKAVRLRKNNLRVQLKVTMLMLMMMTHPVYASSLKIS